MLFVGTSIIHPSTEGVFLLCNILDLLIYSSNLVYHVFHGEQGKDTKKPNIVKNFFDIIFLLKFSPEIRIFPKIRALMKEAELFGNPLAQKRCGLFDER